MCFPPHSFSTLCSFASFTIENSVRFNRPIRAAVAQEPCILATVCGCVSREFVLGNQGRRFPCLSARHCSVPLKLHACGRETKPAEFCLSARWKNTYAQILWSHSLPPKTADPGRTLTGLRGGLHGARRLRFVGNILDDFLLRVLQGHAGNKRSQWNQIGDDEGFPPWGRTCG